MEVGGQLIQGGQNIFFAQLADPNTVHFSADATRYFSGEFIFMIFGLPGAALAMYHCAKPEKKKVAGGLLFVCGTDQHVHRHHRNRSSSPSCSLRRCCLSYR